MIPNAVVKEKVRKYIAQYGVKGFCDLSGISSPQIYRIIDDNKKINLRDKTFDRLLAAFTPFDRDEITKSYLGETAGGTMILDQEFIKTAEDFRKSKNWSYDELADYFNMDFVKLCTWLRSKDEVHLKGFEDVSKALSIFIELKKHLYNK